jgi:hypothetical protein
MTVGTETLGRGDGLFVPAETAYTFFTGPQVVEFVEYRHANSWNIVFRTRNPDAWARIADKASAQREAWKSERQPFGLVEPVE